MIILENFIITNNKEKTKVKFNMHSDKLSALYALCTDFDGEWKGMNSWRTVPPTTTHYLDGNDYLIALAQYYPYSFKHYIFGGLYEIVNINPKVTNGYGYELALVDKYQEYIKRLIIKVEKPVEQAITRNYKTLQQQLNPVIYEIRKPFCNNNRTQSSH